MNPLMVIFHKYDCVETQRLEAHVIKLIQQFQEGSKFTAFSIMPLLTNRELQFLDMICSDYAGDIAAGVPEAYVGALISELFQKGKIDLADVNQQKEFCYFTR